MEIKIPIKYVIELGIIRKRDKCAKCDKQMDVPFYNIQLCKKCRIVELKKYAEESLATHNHANITHNKGESK